MLKLAVAKGRVLDETLLLLKKINIYPVTDINSRALVIDTNVNLQLMVIRTTDTPIYVEHGAADIGIVGKDVLLEHGSLEIYEPLDLKIAKCRLMTAGIIGVSEPKGTLKVATKFTNVAKNYYESIGRQVDIIKLYGSMELAPVVGLADKIIDVVDTGKTLKANGLEPQEVVANITSRLIVNKAAMKTKYDKIHSLIEKLKTVVDGR